jgi:hypothetical protein
VRRDAARAELAGEYLHDGRRRVLEGQDDELGDRDQAPSPESLVLLP